MAQQYSPQFNKWLQRKVKNFNARRATAAKQGDNENLPNAVKVKDLKTYYGKDEAAIRRRIKQLDAFSAKDFTETMTVGKYSTKVNKYRYQRYLENREHALSELETAIDRQKRLDRSKGLRLPSDYTAELIARKRTIEKGTSAKATKQQINAAMNYALRWTEHRLETDQQFYQNFDTMFFSQTDKVGVDPALIENMQAQFRQLDPDELLDLFENEPDINRIVHNYNLTKDTEGNYLTKREIRTEKKDIEELAEVLPDLVKKYKRA